VGRAMYSRAVEHRFVDDMTEADAAFRGAQKLALELGATSIAIAIVTKRSATAAMHDPAAAKSMAALAGDLADRPGVHPIDRARALGAIGNSASATGDYKTAIAKLREALAIVMATGQHDPIEVELRFSLLNARYAASDRSPELVALGRETAQRVKEMYGERNPNYGVAL